MVTILGTTFGHGFGNPFCVCLRKVGQRWECDCAQFVTHPCRHDEETNNASRRPKSNKAARAYQKAWRTALFDLARRDSLVLSVPRAFQNFGDQNMSPASARAEGSNLLRQFAKPRAKGSPSNAQGSESSRRAESNKAARAYQKAWHSLRRAKSNKVAHAYQKAWHSPSRGYSKILGTKACSQNKDH